MNGLLTALIVLVSVTLIVLVAAAIIYIRQLARAVDEITETSRVLREEIAPLSRSMRQTLSEIDTLADSAQHCMSRCSRVMEAVDSWVEGRAVVDVAGKAVSSSKATVISVVEGIKEGLRSFKKPKMEP